MAAFIPKQYKKDPITIRIDSKNLNKLTGQHLHTI